MRVTGLRLVYYAIVNPITGMVLMLNESDWASIAYVQAHQDEPAMEIATFSSLVRAQRVAQRFPGAEVLPCE